jgi:hypothetical protein
MGESDHPITMANYVQIRIRLYEAELQSIE